MDDIILTNLSTNSKIAGFVTAWKQFKGFSLLFDNPNESRKGKQLIKTPGKNPELELFRLIRETFYKLTPMPTETNLICPVPYSSYHVTVFDGINDDNVDKISPSTEGKMKEFLAQLPNSLLENLEFIKAIEESPLIIKDDWNIKFKFSKITTILKRKALVATLEPADSSSDEKFKELVFEREKLYKKLSDLIKINYHDFYEPFNPHLSLGYFPNNNASLQITGIKSEWNEFFKKRISTETITFNSISLYGFSNIVNFYDKSMINSA